MNILYDYQVFALQRYGGVSRIFYELISHMIEKDQVGLYLFQGYYINDFPMEKLKDRMEFYFGKRTINFPHISVLLKLINHVIFSTFIYDKPIDIYHPSNYSSIVYNWRKSPVLLTINDMIPELFPENFRDIHSRLKSKRKCIERADKIITISHLTRNDLLNYYQIEKDKVKVIYPGAPGIVTKKKQNQPQFNHRKPFILYVGTRRQEYKNFKNLLLAYCLSKKINKEFDLLCFGGPPFNRNEKRMMSGLSCLDNVFQINGNDHLLSELYSKASAFIYPSLYEGFGLPPLEAMAYGCPVIASSEGAIPEVLGDAADFFDAHNPEAIAAAIEKVLFDEYLRQEMIKKGKHKVRKYSWAKMGDEMYLVYKELVG
jgi:glycosyltransferase involved in cell wall biosynthesis